MKKNIIGLLLFFLFISANANPSYARPNVATKVKPEKNDWIFLHQAAKHGIITDLKKTLQNRHDVNAIGYGHTTALHCAASNGHATCLAILLQNGADATIKNVKGQIPLHCAAAQGHLACVQKLLAHNPDSVHAVDNHEWTSLHHAASSGDITCVKELRSCGAILDPLDEYDQTPEDVARKKGYFDIANYLDRKIAKEQYPKNTQTTIAKEFS